MEEETTGGQNRLFVILAISLIGLLVFGLVGIGGVFIIRTASSSNNSKALGTFCFKHDHWVSEVSLGIDPKYRLCSLLTILQFASDQTVG